MNLNINRTLFVIFLFLLNGCGGGSGDNSATQDCSDSVNCIPSPGDSNSGDSDNPIIENVAINGSIHLPNHKIAASYDYSNAAGVSEGQTKIRWIRNGEMINEGSEDTYTLTADDGGATFKVEIIPTSAEGITGTLVTSEEYQINFPQEFTVRSSCTNYRYAVAHNIIMDSEGWYVFPKKSKLQIVDDYGNVVDDLITLRSNSLDISYPVSDTTYAYLNSTSKEYYTEVSNKLSHPDNKNNNILISCYYFNESTAEEISFSMFIPIAEQKVWAATKERLSNDNINNSFFEVSFLSDLYYRIYLAEMNNHGEKGLAIQRAREYFSTNFPNLAYKELDATETQTRNGLLQLKSPDSSQGAKYSQMQHLANSVAAGRVDLVLDQIETNYTSYVLENNGCLDKVLCVAFIKDSRKPLTEDYTFEHGTDKWSVSQNVVSGAAASIKSILKGTSPKDHDIELSFSNSYHNNSELPTKLEVFDVIEVTPENLSNLIFSYENIKANAGCDEYAGLCLSTGFAGYYFCLVNSETNMSFGCYMDITWDDPITLNIYFGNLLNVSSSEQNYITKAADERYIATVSVGEILSQHLHFARNNLSNIDSIYYGAIASEITTSDGICQKCKAHLAIRDMGLFEVSSSQ